MEISLDSILSLTTLFTSFVAALALVLAYRQTKIVEKGHFSERRPYIVPRFEAVNVTKGSAKIYLVLTNFGNTPAKDIRLEFTDDNAWNDISSTSHFPFLSPNLGISVIPPGEQKHYFVGQITPTSKLQDLRLNETTVLVLFGMYGEKQEIRDSFRLTLKDFAGSQALPKLAKKSQGSL